MLKNPDKNSFFFIEREKSSLMHDTFMSINCIQHWLASSLRLSNKLSRAFHWTEDARQLFLGSFVAVRCLALHKLLQLVLQSFITKKNRFLLKKIKHTYKARNRMWWRSHLETEEMAFLVLICTQDETELQRKTDGLAAQRSPFADQTRLFPGMWVQSSLDVEPWLDSPCEITTSCFRFKLSKR